MDDTLCDITFTKDEILKELKDINPNKAPGPDGLSSRVLKTCCVELAGPVQTLFNQSLQTSKVPTDWKRANVAPIFKKGSKVEPSNYRPVSLLPIISKTLERCILNKILDTIAPKISKLQHGFMKGKSTMTQIMTVLSNIHRIFDERKQTDVIYFDLSKAFDSVPHKLLIHKLKSFGIHGRLLDWITHYLSDRKQRVTLDGTCSAWLPVASGVPQGSILGPILFLLYINDLPDILSPDTLCAIFADDTKIYRQITDIADTKALQEDINNIALWGQTWGLKFNNTKTVHLTIATKTSIETTFTMGEDNIEKVESTNDLGIEVRNDLKWSSHIDKIVKKAKQRLGLIIRTLGFDAPRRAKQTAYISLVRSILETGSQLWSPHDKDSLSKLEKVQRTATKYITNNPHITQQGYVNYKTRLLETGLLPLSYRREIADLSYFCKHLHSDITNLIDFITENKRQGGIRTRSQSQAITYTIPKTKTSQSAHFYPARIARLWNSLPENLRETLQFQRNSTIVKQHLIPLYKIELSNLFDPDNTCTWIHTCQCTRCRQT
jgi:hypothetical protein